MADQNCHVRKEMETYPVKGESITIEANVTYCDVCGEQIWDQELDDENLVKAFRIYREKHNLLQPEDIKNTREKYGLTQMAFAQILGLGDKTIARYEAGSIQDASPNTLIHLSKYPNVFKDMVEINKVRIPEALYQSVLERLSEFEPKVIRKGEKIQYKTNANHYVVEDTMGGCVMYGGLKYGCAG